MAQHVEEQFTTAAFDSAFQFYSQCLKYNPSHVLGLYGIAQIYVYKKEYKAAITNLKHAQRAIRRAQVEEDGEETLELMYPIRRILAYLYLEVGSIIKAYAEFHDILLPHLELSVPSPSEPVADGSKKPNHYYHYDSEAWLEYSSVLVRLFLDKQALNALCKKLNLPSGVLAQEHVILAAIHAIDRGIQINQQEMGKDVSCEVLLNHGGYYIYALSEESLNWNQNPSFHHQRINLANKAKTTMDACLAKINLAITENAADPDLHAFYQSLYDTASYNLARLFECTNQNEAAFHTYISLKTKLEASYLLLLENQPSAMAPVLLADTILRLGVLSRTISNGMYKEDAISKTAAAEVDYYKSISLANQKKFDLESIIRAKILTGLHHSTKKEFRTAQATFEEIIFSHNQLQQGLPSSANLAQIKNGYTRNLLGNIFLNGAQALNLNQYSLFNLSKTVEVQKQLKRASSTTKMEVYLAKGQEVFSSILKTSSNKDIYAANGLACTLAEQGLFSSALSIFLAVKDQLQISKQSPKILYDNHLNIGHCYLNLGMLDHAIKSYNTCLKTLYFLDALAPPAKYSEQLGVYDKHDLNIKRPNIISAMLFLARAYYKLEDYTSSTNILQRLVQLSPNSNDLLLNYGFSHERLAVSIIKKTSDPTQMPLDDIQAATSHVNTSISIYTRIQEHLAAASAQKHPAVATTAQTITASAGVEKADDQFSDEHKTSAAENEGSLERQQDKCVPMTSDKPGDTAADENNGGPNDGDASELLKAETAKMGMGRVQPQEDKAQNYKGSYHYQKSDFEIKACMSLLKELSYYEAKVRQRLGSHGDKLVVAGNSGLSSNSPIDANQEVNVLAGSAFLSYTYPPQISTSISNSDRKSYLSAAESAVAAEQSSKNMIEALRASDAPKKTSAGNKKKRKDNPSSEIVSDDNGLFSDSSDSPSPRQPAKTPQTKKRKLRKNKKDPSLSSSSSESSDNKVDEEQEASLSEADSDISLP